MKKQHLYAALAAALLGIGASAGAAAQTTTPYLDTACGTWSADTWTPNGKCVSDTHRHEKITGTITSVKGHLVTVAQTDKSVVIDDTPALKDQLTGEVAVGRRIVAHGYWDGGTFYATIILTQMAGAPAQTAYLDTACGMWNGDTWTPNGKCVSDTRRHEKISGTITSVKGHLVTIAQTGKSVTIDDTPALKNQLTGEVAVGRRIVAHGYWDADTFYATIILTQPA